MNKRNESSAIDYDTRWKVLIEKHPAAFIHRFFPDVFPQVDFSIKPKFLQQEIHKLVARRKKRGGMKPDLVMEVRLLGGEKRFLYVHIEVQQRHVRDFGVKMFRPFYWIFDTYGVEIAAIAIFLGPSLPKNHDHFEYSFGKTKLRYDYPVIVVKNLDEAKLMASGSVFDLALLACKYVLRTQGKGKSLDRYELARDLMGFLLENPLGHDLGEDELQSIVVFVLNLLILPPELEHKLTTEIQEKYIKPKEMQRLDTHRERNFMDALTKAFYGEPVSEMAKKLKKAESGLKKAETERLLAEQKSRLAEAEKQRAEAEKQRAEAEKIKTICNLSTDLKFPADKIAQIMELDVSYIQAVLDKYQRL